MTHAKKVERQMKKTKNGDTPTPSRRLVAPSSHHCPHFKLLVTSIFDTDAVIARCRTIVKKRKLVEREKEARITTGVHANTDGGRRVKNRLRQGRVFD